MIHSALNSMENEIKAKAMWLVLRKKVVVSRVPAKQSRVRLQRQKEERSKEVMVLTFIAETGE